MTDPYRDSTENKLANMDKRIQELESRLQYYSKEKDPTILNALKNKIIELIRHEYTTSFVVGTAITVFVLYGLGVMAQGCNRTPQEIAADDARLQTLRGVSEQSCESINMHVGIATSERYTCFDENRSIIFFSDGTTQVTVFDQNH